MIKVYDDGSIELTRGNSADLTVQPTLVGESDPIVPVEGDRLIFTVGYGLKVTKALSTKNGATTGAFGQDGIVLYGYVSSFFSPYFTIEKYTAGATVTTQTGAVSFIYWR